MQEQTQSMQRDGRPDVLTGIYFSALLRRTIAAERHPGPLEVRLDLEDVKLEASKDELQTGTGMEAEKVKATVAITKGQATWV
jgi:hypothetical protein